MRFLLFIVALFVAVDVFAFSGYTEIVKPDRQAIGPDSQSHYGFKGVKKNTETGQPSNHATVLVPKDMIDGTLDEREQRLVQEAQKLAERLANGEPVLEELARINGTRLSNGSDPDVPSQKANKPNPDRPIEDSPSKGDTTDE